MEMSKKDYRILITSIFAAFLLAAVLYSCGTQKSVAITPELKVNNISILPKNTVKQDTIKARPVTKEQADFARKLNFVLDNSGKTFNDVSSIANSMNNMSGRLEKLTDVILTRATELRIKNDSLVHLVFEGNKQNKELLMLALSESKARQANEKKTEEDRKQNIANSKAQSLYTTIGITAMMGLLIAAFLIYLDIRRLRSKVKLVTQYE